MAKKENPRAPTKAEKSPEEPKAGPQFQNMSAQMISGIPPGKTMRVTEERGDRLRDSSVVRAGLLVEVTAPAPMPKPKLGSLTAVKPQEALRLIAQETDKEILKGWYLAAEKEKRTDLLEALQARADELK